MNTEMENILSKIDDLTNEYFGVWEDVCNIESPTNLKEGVDAVGQYFIQMADEKGWKTEIFKQGLAIEPKA